MSPKREEGGLPGLHADEGEIHAFLDGAVDVLGEDRAAQVRAHMDGCRPCRDRLAVEAAVRDRAGTLLGADDPLAGAVLPTLEELRARARAGATPPGNHEARGGAAGGAVGGGSIGGARSGRRFGARVALGWAATVILSLGVGYGVGVVGPRGSAPAMAPTERAPEVGPGPEVGRAAAASAEGVAGGMPAEESTAAAGELRQGAPAPAPATEQRLAADRADAVAPPRGGDPASAEAGRTATVGGAAVRPVDSAGAGSRDAPSAAPSAAGAAGDSAVRRARADATPPAPPAAEPVPSTRLTSPLAGLPDRSADPAAPAAVQTSAAAARAPILVAEAVGEPRGGAAGQVAEVEEATSGLVGLALPGGIVRDVRWGEVWPGQEGVVVTQDLADGRRVELRMAGAPVGGAGAVAPPIGLPEPARGWSRAFRVLDGGWAVLDGALPVVELAELLAALR